jgi:hypothetical protein
MQGETYVGRAFVVNAWYLAAYQPIRDAQGGFWACSSSACRNRKAPPCSSPPSR